MIVTRNNLVLVSQTATNFILFNYSLKF